jgi:hypothetical protein
MSSEGDLTPPTPPPSGQLLIYREGAVNLHVRLDGQTVWLSQRQIADLYQTTVANINQHLASIYEDNELLPEATIKRYLIVQVEGTRQVRRLVDHYNLDAVLAVGYRVRSSRGTQFRQWATQQLSQLLTKGFVLDDERIKAGRTIGQDYFDELLARIRDIRASERLFYQKVTDLYATSIDYSASADVSRAFFSAVQNKLHWAIHGHTAAEIIYHRADAAKPQMGLTSWKLAPDGPVRRGDVEIAKNYLTEPEIAELNRIVSMYLDYAEDQARKKKPMHMNDWAEKLDAFLQFNERNILTHAGKISHELAIEHAHGEFERYEARRLDQESRRQSDFDKLVDESRRLQSPAPPPAETFEPKVKDAKSGKPRRRRKADGDHGAR